MAEPMGYRLHWQDFTGRRIGMGDPLPPACSSDHATRAEAEAARSRLILGPDVITTITPIYPKVRRTRSWPAEWAEQLPVRRAAYTS